MTKTLPEATALQLPFYEQKLHYTVKPLNLSMWDRHHMWSEQMNSHLLSREELPFAITATIQIPDYIYIWRFELEQGSSSQTQSIFWKYTEQKIACILQCKNSATKSFIADQETVSRD